MQAAGERSAENYLEQISAIAHPISNSDPEAEKLVRDMVDEINLLDEVNVEALAQLIAAEPRYVPILGSVVGLSQERLKRQLHTKTGSEAWTKRAKSEPLTIIGMLDREFSLTERLTEGRNRSYTLADVLIARADRGLGASGAIDAGRKLENYVEVLIQDLGLPYQARTRYEGKSGQTGPADFALPTGGQECRIAIGVKGFDSTGSKLTAAHDEVRKMADVRRPKQYIFAVVDGLAWSARKGDLNRLIEMVKNHDIDGMFALSEFEIFRTSLRDAALRSRLLDPA